MAIAHRSHLANRRGKLIIDDVSVSSLVQRFPTPLYVYSARRIRKNYLHLRNTLRQEDRRIVVAYSLKANANPALVQVLADAGAGADCASIAELRIAKRAGMRHRVYTGVYAPQKEIEQACSLAEMISLDDISRLQHVPAGYRGIVAFRVNPGSGSGSHPGIITGGKTKFGIPTKSLLSAYQVAQKKGVTRFGLHMMIGSGELDWRLFVSRVRIAFDIAQKINGALGITIELIDIGGGLGIPYHPTQKPLDVVRMAKGVGALMQGHAAAPDTLLFEPGRAIVGDAGILLATVTAVKTDPMRYVGIDAGMHTLLRPALYGAYHHVLAAEKLNVRHHVRSTIVGPICETTDVIALNRLLPALAEGDVIAILDTGAYGTAMSSRYGNRGSPVEVLVKGRTVKKI